VETLTSIGMGFQTALTPGNLLACFIGVLTGTLVGVLPGLGPVAAMSLLLPTTFHISPVAAIIMMAGIYYGAMYGGSTTSILVNIPGESASVVTCLDGYQMARQGRAGPALGIAALGSFIAGTFATIGLMLAAPPLARLAIKFGPPEYFALILLGLTTVTFLASGPMWKALLMAALGLFLGCIGMDPRTGLSRFTFNLIELYDGVGLVPVAMGLFGISEVLLNVEQSMQRTVVEAKIKNLLPTRADWAASIAPILRGTGLGFFLGVLPGGGSLISSFASYAMEKKLSRHPERFGKGAIEGVAWCETANNSAVPGAFVPLLTLGIPGSSAAAVLIGALMIQGLQPGPLLFERNPEIPYSIFAGLLLSTPIMLVVGLGGARLFAKLTLVPKSILGTVVLGVCLLGSFALGNNIFPVWIACGFGILGYLMRKFDFPIAAMVLAMVLGEMAENNFRLSMLMGEGSWSIFLTRPISLVIFLLTAVMFCWPLVNSWIRRKQAEVASPAPDKRNGR